MRRPRLFPGTSEWGNPSSGVVFCIWPVHQNLNHEHARSVKHTLNRLCCLEMPSITPAPTSKPGAGVLDSSDLKSTTWPAPQVRRLPTNRGGTNSRDSQLKSFPSTGDSCKGPSHNGFPRDRSLDEPVVPQSIASVPFRDRLFNFRTTDALGRMGVTGETDGGVVMAIRGHGKDECLRGIGAVCPKKGEKMRGIEDGSVSDGVGWYEKKRLKDRTAQRRIETPKNELKRALFKIFSLETCSQ